MDLIVVKNGVDYALDTGDAAVDTVAKIPTLKDGSVVFSTDANAVIPSPVAGAVAGEKGYMHINHGGHIQRITAIDRATAKLVEPMGTDPAVAKVVTLDAVPVGMTAELLYTGFQVTDLQAPYYDTGKIFNADFGVDENTTLTTHYAKLVARLESHEKIASVVNAAGSLTITLVAGANLSFIGLGYSEGKKDVVSTALEYGQLMTSYQLSELARKVSASDGNNNSHMDGAPEIFTKDYGVEDGVNYEVYLIESRNKNGYTSNDGDTVPNLVYFAVPTGHIPEVGETWLDLINALLGV